MTKASLLGPSLILLIPTNKKVVLLHLHNQGRTFKFENALAIAMYCLLKGNQPLTNSQEDGWKGLVELSLDSQAKMDCSVFVKMAVCL